MTLYISLQYDVLASPETSHASPISPSELLIALHRIPPEECEIKIVMAGKRKYFILIDRSTLFE